MSKGGSSGSGTVVQKSEPPAYLLPFLKQAMTGAQDLYNKGPQPLFPGQTYAPINSTQQQGLNATLAYGNSPANPYAADGLSALDASANSTPGSNPYLDQLMEAYGGKANQMVASNFNSGGRYGSGAQAGAAGDAITKATLPFLFDQYNKDMTNKLQSAAILPGLSNQQDALALNKAQAIGTVGDAYAGQDQNAINEATSRFQYANGGGEQSALDNYISEINSNPYSKSQSTTQTTNGPKPGIGSTIGGIVSGLGTLGGLGTGLSSFLGAGSGLASALGGTSGFLGSLGSLFSVFSDERLKENFVPVGEENGHKIYEFNYKDGTGTRYVGVKAQEVMEKAPEAVMRGGYGLLSVDYGKIGVRFRKAADNSPFTEESARRAAALASPGGRVEVGAAGCGPTADCRGL